MKNIYFRLLQKLREGTPLALATLIDSRGSIPQVPGASAIFSAEGLAAGTIGGGALEHEVEQRAKHALEKKLSFLFEFTLEEEVTSDEGALCGGKALLLIDGNPAENEKTFEKLCESLRKGKPGILTNTIVILNNEEIYSLSRTWVEEEEILKGRIEETLTNFKKELSTSLKEERPLLRFVREKGREETRTLLFFEPLFPPAQLLIAGAGHIGRVVSHLGSLLNFEVTVIDDRSEFANRERIPDADQIIVDDIGNALRDFPITRNTYIVIVTRGHRHDGEALRSCINSQAAYIGMIGSKRKVSLMRKQFLEEGWATAEAFDRIHAPIGLPIKSETVEEIGVSIAAELVLVRQEEKKRKRERK